LRARQIGRVAHPLVSHPERRHALLHERSLPVSLDRTLWPVLLTDELEGKQ
jgi:hypothetical protein